MKELMVDGERFIRASDAQGGPIKIVILERGFVYVGRCREEGLIHLTIYGARSLIRWGTSKHLGELADGPLDNTKLGDSCTVKVRFPQVIHIIEVSQDAWDKHIK